MYNLEKLNNEARVGDFSLEDMEVVVPELEKLKPGDVYLEIGVNQGRSLSVARTVTNSKVKVIGVDLKADPKVEGTTFYQGDGVEVAKLYNDGAISLLFIDGDHTYQGCKRDIEAWCQYLNKDGVMFFHDCDESSPGVMWAVSEFVYTHSCGFFLFKYNNKNTSLAKVILQ